MATDAFASRIFSLHNRKNMDKVKSKTLTQNRLQVVRSKLIMTSIQKTQFAKPNNTRFYLADGVILLPVCNPYLEELRKYNKDLQKLKEQLLQENKFNMLKLGN